LYNAVESGESVSNQNLISYLIDRLDSLEKSINLDRRASYVKRKSKSVEIIFNIDSASDKIGFKPELNALVRNIEELGIIEPRYNSSGLIINFSSSAELEAILKKIKLLLNKFEVN
jgi:uncharacterized protein YjgD (DUF1641 family)